MSHRLPIGSKVTLEITDLGHSGEGVGHINGRSVFIDGALPGETVEAVIRSSASSYSKGSIQQIHKPSLARTTPPCPIYSECGGCQLQHMGYANQLDWKTHRVTTAMAKIAKRADITPSPTIGMSTPYYYRNKVLIPLGRSRTGDIVGGFYKTGSHDIVPMKACMIQDARFDPILPVVIEFLNTCNLSVYDETTHSGVAKGILARCSENELTVTLIINAEDLAYKTEFVHYLRQIPAITGIGIMKNQTQTNVPITDQTDTLWGSLDLAFRFPQLQLTAPCHGFFQVNTHQTGRLISEIRAAIPEKVDTIFDLYCGVGTLGLSVAAQCDRLLGNEISPVAIEYAQKNAMLNQYSHCHFVSGDAFSVTQQWVKLGYTPDIVIVDPPRKGCSPEMIDLLVRLRPPRILYVSCDPATLARDIKLLSDIYLVDRLQPIDMFPQTAHVETVALLG